MIKKVLITDIHHGNGGGHVTYILSLLTGQPRTALMLQGCEHPVNYSLQK